MNRVLTALCVILLLSSCFGLHGAKADTTMPVILANSRFAEGNAYYRAQKYEQAKEVYQALVRAGYDSAPVLYNLGTTDARLGSTTLAQANLMRAHRLRPRSADIKANLAYVMPLPAAPASDADATTGAESLWSRVYGFFTAEEWLAMLWITLMLICTGGALWILSRRNSLRTAARIMIGSGAVGLLIIFIPAATQYYKTRVIKKMMVIGPTELLSGPAERFTRVANLAEGQVVRALDHATEDYQRVQLDNGLQGYADTDSMMKL